MDWQPFDAGRAGGSGNGEHGRHRLSTHTESQTVVCRIEGGDFRSDELSSPEELVVWAYNVERGLRVDEQLATIARDPGMPAPDILLLSEVDRGCSRTDGRNIARDYATALSMAYVYAVEFVELPRWWGPGGGRVERTCEHGNAILSRYPLGNVRMIRHELARSWNSPWQRRLRIGQPRLGGRVAIVADVHLGDRLLRVYSVHLESGTSRRGPISRDDYRTAQARELVEDASTCTYGVVIGGDMNVSSYLHELDGGTPDPTVAALTDAGYHDAHARIDASERITSDSGTILDLIVGRNVQIAASGVGPAATWKGLSDHLPVWTRLLP